MFAELEYGNEKIKVEIPDRNLLHVISSRHLKAIANPQGAIFNGLKDPVGCGPLSEKIKGKKNICIVISDSTRAVPTQLILEALLAEIESCGIKKDAITILVATGLHRPNLGKELGSLVGEKIAGSYRIINHYARDRQSCVDIGQTGRGTPIIINKNYVEADFKILTGLIEPHFMAGFSGGRKAICPGISYMDMFKHFHGPEILESPKAAFGVLEGNPFHEESTEIAKKAGVDFIVNVTINKQKEVTGVFCGDLEKAFYSGAKFCLEASVCEIQKEADIVVTSGGGLPLDATLYQTVKGMVGAMPAVKQGGIIVCAAECTEEIGSREFVEIVQEEDDIDKFMEKIRRKDYFKIDQWEFEELVRAKRKADIYLYSGCLLEGASAIPRSTLKLVRSVEEAIKLGLERFGKDATISVIGEGPYVIPVLK
jgi:lactate racemase